MKHLLPNKRYALLKKTAFTFLSIALLALVFMACEQKGDQDGGYGEIPSPVVFTPNIPVDVDPAVQQRLKSQKEIYQLNEVFNKYSWQAFVAIQWPRDGEGNPMPNFTDDGSATWLGWKEAFQVYQADGQKPAPWGSPRTASGLGLPDHVLSDNDSRVILSSNTPTHPDNFNIADEVDQAFAGKLFDQNGNVVVYEVLMNEVEFDYIMEKSLYNINGQINYSKQNDSLANFPKGNYEKDSLGAVEIKFAWKILEDSDFKERYFTDKGWIIGPDSTLVQKDLGMIGMHISQKTPTGKQWVWSTFEHVDNLEQNVIEKDGKTLLIPPTLRDPNCDICPANVDVTHNSRYYYEEDEHGPYWLVRTQVGNTKDSTDVKYYASSNVMKTQAMRMMPIPVRVKNVNKMMQDYFRSVGSVWQYYELIDTQYPLDQNIPPAPNLSSNYVLPESVTNKPGGDPNIPLLTNMTMETFFQKGNQAAGNLIENGSATGEPRTIYGTESCMGCHSSAGIYSYIDPNGKPQTSGQLSGDFSWLLQKAQWNKDSIPGQN